MNISKTQYNSKEKEITKQLLQNGIKPNSFEVSSRLTEYFDINLLGLPYYKPINIKEHEISNSKTWNTMFEKLGTDLDIVYKTNVEQNNKILDMEENYLIEKNKVSSKLDKLQLRLINLQESIQLGKVTQNYCQTFENFYNIEFNGDISRNIPYTTSYVDLTQNKIYNDKISKSKDKQDITEASIYINTLNTNSSVESSGEITSILKDTINDFYIYNVTSKINSELSIEVNVELPNTTKISSITLAITSSNSVSGELSVSNDGNGYTNMYTVSNDSILEWNFEMTSLKFIKIILKKQEADGYNLGLYDYYYVIKNLSVTSETFLNKSVYVSKPITFGNLIENITINFNDLIFPYTNINYFIGLDNDINEVSWQFIENGVPCDLNLLTSKIEIINKSTLDYGENIDDGCFKICKVPDNINLNTLKLNPGYQMWRIESLDLYRGYGKTEAYAPNLYVLKQNDYNTDMIVPFGTGTIDNESYNLSIRSGLMHVFTQYVFCEEEIIIDSKYIKYTNPNGANGIDFQCQLYINNSLVNPYNTDSKFYTSLDYADFVTLYYNLRLKKGRNKVQILIFANNKDIDNETSFVEVEHNINFKECTSDIFVAPQMKLTSIHALRYKTLHNSDKFYAIDENNYLAVENNPLAICTTVVPILPGYFDDNERQMRYLLSYKSSIENTKTNFRFRIMATLLSSKEDVSPQILSYRIIGQ